MRLVLIYLEKLLLNFTNGRVVSCARVAEEDILLSDWIKQTESNIQCFYLFLHSKASVVGIDGHTYLATHALSNGSKQPSMRMELAQYS